MSYWTKIPLFSFGLKALQIRTAFFISIFCNPGCSQTQNVFLKKKTSAQSKNSTSGETTFNPQIAPIIQERCISCHGIESLHTRLDTFSLVRAAGNEVVEAVLTRRMPKWLAQSRHEEYLDDPSLSEEQLDLFKKWKEGGFQEGTAPIQAIQSKSTSNFEPNVILPSLGSAKSYELNKNLVDEYRCFLAKVPDSVQPSTKNKYVSAARFLPGNRSVVHHMTLVSISRDLTKATEIIDEMDIAPGFLCDGSLLPIALEDPSIRERLEQSLPGIVNRFLDETNWIAIWNPGMNGGAFPAETGILLPPESAFVIQYHFHANSSSSHHLIGEHPITETGGQIEIKIEDNVKKPALFLALHNRYWGDARNNHSLVLPPESDRSVSAETPVSSFISEIKKNLAVETIKTIEIHSTNLHMHQRGHSGETWLKKGENAKDILLSINSYDAYNQRDYFFKTPKRIAIEEAEQSILGVRCNYRNQSKETIYGGAFSGDEMCINFFLLSVTEQ